MDDLISRKVAIDAFGLSEKTRKYGGDHSGYDTRMLYEIQDTLESLPSVQPEHGHWIGKPIAGYSTVRCSKCGNVLLENDGRFPYCPHCGAKMD